MMGNGRSSVMRSSFSAKIVAVLMSALLAVTIPFTMASQQKTAYADTASELASVQAQVDAANQKLLDIASELTVANDELYDIQTQQADVNSQIVDTQRQVDEAQAKYDAAMDSLKKQAVQNYTSDQVDYLSVLMSSTSFSDFTTRLYLVDKMMSQQQDTINTVTAAKADLETKQADLQSQKSQLDALEASAQEKSATIQTALDEQTSYLAGLSGQVTSLMAQQAAEQAAASAAAAAAAVAKISSTSSSSAGSSGNSWSGSAGQIAAQAAASKEGCYYDLGSSGPSLFDCSGLVMWAYAQAGVELYRTAADQYSQCSIFYDSNELQVGDLVFYRYSGSIGHVAIYAGDGKMVEATVPGSTVQCNPVRTTNFAGFGRL